MVPPTRITKLKLLLLGNVTPDGDWIRDYEVAMACRMTQDTLSDYSRGKRPITQKNLFALAEYFKVDPNDLIGWVEIQFPEYEDAKG